MDKEPIIHGIAVIELVEVKNSKGQYDDLTFYTRCKIYTNTNQVEVSYIVSALKGKEDAFHSVYSDYGEAVDKYNELRCRFIITDA